jgi:hypothetical protein
MPKQGLPIERSKLGPILFIYGGGPWGLNFEQNEGQSLYSNFCRRIDAWMVRMLAILSSGLSPARGTRQRPACSTASSHFPTDPFFWDMLRGPGTGCR